MKNTARHWNLSPADAVKLQRELADRVIERAPEKFAPRFIAAADISANRFSNRLFAAVVVMKYPEMEPVETATAMRDEKFPYVPGLLSFRELPVVCEAFDKLKTTPDVLLLDGHGKAHPRRFGLACHAGVVLDIPSIGVAKSILVGAHAALPEEMGGSADLIDREEVVGRALRTRSRVKPVYISIGHKIDLDTACEIVLSCGSGTRLPAPSRAAHEAANAARKAFEPEKKGW